MIRTKGEAGTGNIVEAKRHLTLLQREIRSLAGLSAAELVHVAKELGAPLELVKEVQAHRQERRPDAGTRFLCPRCQEPLAETYDLCRDTRFRFYRCANHHGVFFRFVDFLRSQGLLQGLSDAEVEALKARAQTLQCRNCGAPVAVDAQTCPHCGTPVAWVDQDYLARALRQLADDAKPARR